jgi:hypothetical protein
MKDAGGFERYIFGFYFLMERRKIVWELAETRSCTRFRFTWKLNKLQTNKKANKDPETDGTIFFSDQQTKFQSGVVWILYLVNKFNF